MGRKMFWSVNCQDLIWGLLSLLFRRYRGALSLRVKWLGHEGDHSSPHIAEIKNEWILVCLYNVRRATLPLLLPLPVTYLKYI